MHKKCFHIPSYNCLRITTIALLGKLEKSVPTAAIVFPLTEIDDNWILGVTKYTFFHVEPLKCQIALSEVTT